MKVIYAQDFDIPDSWAYAVFLAGPTPRDEATPSWRPEALQLLEDAGYNGVVFVPEAEGGGFPEGGSYTKQIAWEKQMLHMADAVVFWIPRDLETLPGFTTNVEWGVWSDSVKRVVLGYPEDAAKVRYLAALAKDLHVPVLSDLEETLLAGVKGWEDAPLRTGGERYVPLTIWETPQFKDWYANLTAVGNRLDEADLLWGFRMPKARFVFCWVLWVKVWIAAERRYKENEFVFARTDISTVLLYRHPLNLDVDDPEDLPPIPNLLDYLLGVEVVLIREFRSPARTPDGFVHELPGGSSVKPDQDPLEVAAEEVHEEVGLTLKPDRIKAVGSRQLIGTLSSHHAHLFVAKLTVDEMEEAKRLAVSNTVHGLEEDSERTYVEVSTIRDLLAARTVDWATLGMVFQGALNP